MRILLVEDDDLLGDGIRAGLKLADYAVDWVRDGEAARLALLDHAYQACVLDLGLPKRDGLWLLKDLRERGNPLPVLILTARDSSADKIAGLDAGADDYLVKPFDLPEFEARVRALLRRRQTSIAGRIRIGDLKTGWLKAFIPDEEFTRGAGTEFVGVDSRGRIFSGASGRPGLVVHELARPLF